MYAGGVASPGPQVLGFFVLDSQCLDCEVRIIFAASSFANLGIEGHWQLIDLARLWFRSPHYQFAAGDSHF